MTDAEVLLSSLLSEAPSIWLDDLSSNQDGGKNTITKAGEAEPSDLFRELEQDSLLGNLHPMHFDVCLNCGPHTADPTAATKCDAC